MTKMDQIRDLQKLAVFLDSKYQLPLGLKIGWDSILGLIPFVGDTFTSGISFYILLRAAILGAPPTILLRMGINIIIDNIFDVVPLLGNIFDIFWKSNLKNLAIIENYVANPGRAVKSSRWAILLTLGALIALFVVFFVTVIFASIWIITWALHAISP